MPLAPRRSSESRPLPAPERETPPAQRAARREALDALAVQATTDLIAASNRLVWRYL